MLCLSAVAAPFEGGLHAVKEVFAATDKRHARHSKAMLDKQVVKEHLSLQVRYEAEHQMRFQSSLPTP